MKRLLNTKKISPLLVIIMTGAIGILLVSAGTAGFIVFQGQFLDKVEKQQQTYFNLVDFRDKVIDYGEKSLEKSMPEKAKEMEVLQFMHDRLTSEMGDACPRQDQFFPIPSSGNSKLILLQMQTAIDQVRAESRTAAEELVFFLTRYFSSSFSACFSVSTLPLAGFFITITALPLFLWRSLPGG